MSVFKTYKSKVASRYIPVSAEEIGVRIAESNYYMASVKYDGYLTFLCIENGQPVIYNSSGSLVPVPSLMKEVKFLRDDYILVCELCCFNDDKPTTHREVSATLAKPEKYDLRLAVFDIMDKSGQSVNMEPREKYSHITDMAWSKYIFPVEQKYFESRKDLISYYKDVSPGAEGVVVRSSEGIVYKIKKSVTLDLVLLGYALSAGDRAGMLREFLLGFSLGNNRYQIVTKCGSGFTDKERLEIPKILENMVVYSDYTEVSGAKTAFIMVRPEKVVEISCLDLINENTTGIIRKYILHFDDQNGYSSEHLTPSLSVISPNFVRFRTDKESNENDAGTEQAFALVRPLEDQNHEDVLKKSDIICRAVYQKEGKEGVAIRKFIGLKTNKESSGKFTPFLIIYTDFSPGRKTPMEQELYLCQTQAEVIGKVALLKEENIKKGWELYHES